MPRVMLLKWSTKIIVPWDMTENYGCGPVNEEGLVGGVYHELWFSGSLVYFKKRVLQ
jgi:hypothetical protein